MEVCAIVILPEKARLTNSSGQLGGQESPIPNRCTRKVDLPRLAREQ